MAAWLALWACSDDSGGVLDTDAGGDAASAGAQAISDAGARDLRADAAAMADAAGGAGADEDSGVDVGGAPPEPGCGNRLVEDDEECDGPNLDGASCMSLLGVTGVLLCDPVTCTYSTSLCDNMPIGGAGTGG